MCNDCGRAGSAPPAYDEGCSAKTAGAGFVSVGIGLGMPLTGAQAGKPTPDPMYMPIAHLIDSWYRQDKELRHLRIELSQQKLRVAELEHDRALRVG